MAIDNAPVLAQPVLADRVIYEMQGILKANLSWLDAAFGRVQKLTREIDGKKYTLPNVYVGGLENKGKNDYLELSPDSKIGNFCFFELADPETITWQNGVPMKVATPFSLVFWFDLRRVFGTQTNRNTETLKNDILKLLNGRTGWHLVYGGRVEINKCYEEAKNVYRGYTLDEVDNQYLMHPFAGFRFEGTIFADQPCEEIVPAVKLYDTSDATVGASDIASGKVGYGASGRLVGTGEIAVLQEKSVEPSTSEQEVEPDEGYNGLSKVTVEAVTSEIDANIQAGNIKSGVTILGVTGTVVETNVVTLTQAAYDALSVKDPNTIYLIKD